MNLKNILIGIEGLKVKGNLESIGVAKNIKEK